MIQHRTLVSIDLKIPKLVRYDQFTENSNNHKNREFHW